MQISIEWIGENSFYSLFRSPSIAVSNFSSRLSVDRIMSFVAAAAVAKSRQTQTDFQHAFHDFLPSTSS